MKPIIWLGSTLEDVRRFSSKARQAIGYQLYKVQIGLDPSDWKPMATVGPGVREIRIHTDKEYRVIYIARLEEAIYILHGFTRKSAKTLQSDLNLASRRFQGLLKSRRGGR